MHKKKLITLFMLLFSFGCNNATKFTHQKEDSSIVMVLYIKDFSGNVYGGAAQRVFKDLEEEVMDSSSGEKIKKIQWVRDTFYMVAQWKPQMVGKDTVRDSLKRPVLKPAFDLQIPKRFIYPTSIVIPKGNQ
jgi:hypothetical protein